MTRNRAGFGTEHTRLRTGTRTVQLITSTVQGCVYRTGRNCLTLRTRTRDVLCDDILGIIATNGSITSHRIVVASSNISLFYE
jgi:hypothetical protein